MRAWCPRVVGVAALAAVLNGCASATLPRPSASTQRSTASTSDAAGAMAGFLRAAAAQDNTKVLSWLATPTDTTDLNEVLTVYSSFAADPQRGLFWAVQGLAVTTVRAVDATHANVTLSGNIVWCLGRAANDPAATCSAVNGVHGQQHTYAAQPVDGSWKVDVDIDASSQLDQNPQASPTTAAATASPT